MVDTEKQSHTIELTTRPNGRNGIILRKAKLSGKITSKNLLDTIMIAAQAQVELYIEKLSRGAPLDVTEIKALKELAEISKIDLPNNQPLTLHTQTEGMDRLKQTLYQALTEKSKS